MTAGSRRERTLRYGASASVALAVAVGAACYSTGDGTAPPPNTFYFPVGLVVSAAGNVLYVANSDFDLQWNGGTVQSYDLNQVRNDTVRRILGKPLPWSLTLPLPEAGCPQTENVPNAPLDPNNPAGNNGSPGRLPIGEACAPPIDSTHYWRDSVTIGAFATDIQLSKSKDRLFIPVRGDATLTWIDVVNDKSYAYGALPGQGIRDYPPFALSRLPGYPDVGCNPDSSGRCDAKHHAGTLNDPGNTRQITMPGEPFGMAQTEDGQALALTHQTDTETSLYFTGLVAGSPVRAHPSIQFLLGGLPTAGIGLVAVPHDPAAVPVDPSNPLRPAFLQTSGAVPEIDLLRYYSDEGYQGVIDAGSALVDAGVAIQIPVVLDGGATVSSNQRPFLVREQAFPVAVNSSGTNSRGIAIDPTPRIACEAALPAGTLPTDPRYVACAQLPARVFIASRSPASLVLGQIGGFGAGGVTYEPDQLSIFGNVPLATGPSNVYLAPIVDSGGNYALRVFIVCFESQVIVVWDPDAQRIENVIRTGPGPFAMAFDPFDLDDVANRRPVPRDARGEVTLQLAADPAPGGLTGKSALLRYRFAYIASFTDSFIQVLDLDQSFHDDRLHGSTFETIVYTLGLPTRPKGSQ